jgi:hypothetical protein
MGGIKKHQDELHRVEKKLRGENIQAKRKTELLKNGI